MTPVTLLAALALLQPVADPSRAVGEVVLLDDYGPCGPTSLFLVCQLREVPAEWKRVRQLVGPPDTAGLHSFADLARAASALGMHPVGLRTDRAGLSRLPMPVIVQVHDPRNPHEPPHLLVVVRPEPDGVTLLDPPYPAYFLPDSRFTYAWTGNVLVFARDEAEARHLRAHALAEQWSGVALWVAAAVAALTALALAWSWAVGGWCRQIVAAVPRPSPRRALASLAVLGVTLGGLAVGYHLLQDRPTRRDPAPCCAFDHPV